MQRASPGPASNERKFSSSSEHSMTCDGVSSREEPRTIAKLRTLAKPREASGSRRRNALRRLDAIHGSVRLDLRHEAAVVAATIRAVDPRPSKTLTFASPCQREFANSGGVPALLVAKCSSNGASPAGCDDLSLAQPLPFDTPSSEADARPARQQRPMLPIGRASTRPGTSERRPAARKVVACGRVRRAGCHRSGRAAG